LSSGINFLQHSWIFYCYFYALGSGFQFSESASFFYFPPFFWLSIPLVLQLYCKDAADFSTDAPSKYLLEHPSFLFSSLQLSADDILAKHGIVCRILTRRIAAPVRDTKPHFHISLLSFQYPPALVSCEDQVPAALLDILVFVCSC